MKGHCDESSDVSNDESCCERHEKMDNIPPVLVRIARVTLVVVVCQLCLVYHDKSFVSKLLEKTKVNLNINAQGTRAP